MQDKRKRATGPGCTTGPSESAAPLGGRGARRGCSATCHTALARQHANNMLLPRRFVVTVIVIVYETTDLPGRVTGSIGYQHLRKHRRRKPLRPLRRLPRQHLQVQLVLLAGRQTPPTPRRTARIPRPCGPTSSIDDLARTDLTYRSCWLGISDPGLTHKVRRKTAGGSGHPGGTTVRGSAARGRRRPVPGHRWVVAGVFADSGDRDGDRLADVGDRGVGQPGVRGVAGHPGRPPPGLPGPAGHRAAAVRRRLGWWSCSDDAIHPVRSAGRGARLPRFVPLSSSTPGRRSTQPAPPPRRRTRSGRMVLST